MRFRLFKPVSEIFYDICPDDSFPDRHEFPTIPALGPRSDLEIEFGAYWDQKTPPANMTHEQWLQSLVKRALDEATTANRVASGEFHQ